MASRRAEARARPIAARRSAVPSPVASIKTGQPAVPWMHEFDRVAKPAPALRFEAGMGGVGGPSVLRLARGPSLVQGGHHRPTPRGGAVWSLERARFGHQRLG